MTQQGRRRLFIGLLGVMTPLLQATTAVAGQAVRLFIAAPCPPPTPGQCFMSFVSAGVPFTLGVAAEDAEGNLDRSYTGTWVFTSTDPLATLPSNRTLLPSDEGHLILTDAAVLRTLGTQTITVTETAGSLTPGVTMLTVTAPIPPTAIPATVGVMRLLLVLALAASGAWLVRMTV
jgi:hypothetical protein